MFKLYEQVTSVVQELQSKFPMPSESKLRSIYREVLQDQIIIKSIFSTTIGWAPQNTQTYHWWRIRPLLVVLLMCIVGIINISGGFYRNFDKINQNYHTGVKITKLGREISEISIISPVQMHKLSFLQGIHRNFDIFPQKCVLKQVLLQFGVPLAKFHQYLPSLRIFSSHYIIQRVYAILMVKIHIVKIHIVKKLMLKHFNVKSYYFCILDKY